MAFHCFPVGSVCGCLRAEDKGCAKLRTAGAERHCSFDPCPSDLLRRWHPYQSARSSQVSRPTCWCSTAPPWRHMSFMVRSTICRAGANQHAPDWNTRCQLGKPLKMGANEASAADTQVMLHGMYVNSSGAILSTHETGKAWASIRLLQIPSFLLLTAKLWIATCHSWRACAWRAFNASVRGHMIESEPTCQPHRRHSATTPSTASRTGGIT